MEGNGVRSDEFFYPSSTGEHRIFAKKWLPEGSVRGVVQLVHGVAEHMGRYEQFAQYLTGHGFVVVGADHLGHGRTGTKDNYGHFHARDGWVHAANDVYALRTAQGAEFPNVPYFLFGHSMGSFLARTYLIDHPGTVDGAVLSGTGQEPGAVLAGGKAIAGFLCRKNGVNSRSNLIVALSFGAYNKQFAPARTPSDWISRDAAAVDAYRADPMCGFAPTVGMFRDLMGGMQYIARRENLRKMDADTPVLFLSGACDPVGGNGKGVRKVYRAFQDAGCRNLALKLYPEGRHEMLNELNKDEVYADVLRWLEGQI